MADEERVSFSGDGWRWTGEPINGVLGLHGSVMLLIPSAIATGMVWQFTKLPLFWPFVIFGSCTSRSQLMPPGRAIRRAT